MMTTIHRQLLHSLPRPSSTITEGNGNSIPPSSPLRDGIHCHWRRSTVSGKEEEEEEEGGGGEVNQYHDHFLTTVTPHHLQLLTLPPPSLSPTPITPPTLTTTTLFHFPHERPHHVTLPPSTTTTTSSLNPRKGGGGFWVTTSERNLYWVPESTYLNQSVKEEKEGEREGGDSKRIRRKAGKGKGRRVVVMTDQSEYFILHQPRLIECRTLPHPHQDPTDHDHDHPYLLLLTTHHPSTLELYHVQPSSSSSPTHQPPPPTLIHLHSQPLRFGGIGSSWIGWVPYWGIGKEGEGRSEGWWRRMVKEEEEVKDRKGGGDDENSSHEPKVDHELTTLYHLIATTDGVVYLERTSVPLTPSGSHPRKKGLGGIDSRVRKRVRRDNQWTELIWSTEEPLISLSPILLPNFLFTVSDRGIITALEFIITPSSKDPNDPLVKHHWSPHSRYALPTRPQLIDCTYHHHQLMDGEGGLWIYPLDKEGYIHEVRFEGGEFSYHGTVQRELMRYYKTLPGRSVIGRLGNPREEEDDPGWTRFALSPSGELLQLGFSPPDPTNSSPPPSTSRYPTLPKSLSKIHHNERETSDVDSRIDDAEQLLHSLHQSLKLSHRIYSDPELLQWEMVPNLPDPHRTSPDYHQMNPFRLLVTLRTKSEEGLEFTPGWYCYLRLTPCLPFILDDTQSQLHWQSDCIITRQLPATLTSTTPTIWSWDLPTHHFPLPVIVECGLKFTLPHTSSSSLLGIESDHQVSSLLLTLPSSDATFPLARSYLDLLHFATPAPLVTSPFLPSSYVDLIATTPLTGPLLPTHPFHSRHLNATLLPSPLVHPRSDPPPSESHEATSVTLKLKFPTTTTDELGDPTSFLATLLGNPTLTASDPTTVTLTLPTTSPTPTPTTVTFHLSPSTTSPITHELRLTTPHQPSLPTLLHATLHRLIVQPYQFLPEPPLTEDLHHLWSSSLTSQSHPNQSDHHLLLPALLQALESKLFIHP